jgi:hypothetical protein
MSSKTYNAAMQHILGSTAQNSSPQDQEPNLPASSTAELWKPLPGPQTAGFESPADILGFGGQAGGGKSALLLGLALTAIDYLPTRREADRAMRLRV